MWKDNVLKRCKELEVTIEPDEKVFDSYRTCFSQALDKLRAQNSHKWQKLLKNTASTYIGADALLIMSSLLTRFSFTGAPYSEHAINTPKYYKTVVVGDGAVVCTLNLY